MPANPLFSQHAKKRMQERKISAALVLHCLRHGKYTVERDVYTFSLELSSSGLEVDGALVVIITAAGVVLTTYIRRF